VGTGAVYGTWLVSSRVGTGAAQATGNGTQQPHTARTCEHTAGGVLCAPGVPAPESQSQRPHSSDILVERRPSADVSSVRLGNIRARSGELAAIPLACRLHRRDPRCRSARRRWRTDAAFASSGAPSGNVMASPIAAAQRGEFLPADTAERPSRRSSPSRRGEVSAPSPTAWPAVIDGLEPVRIEHSIAEGFAIDRRCAAPVAPSRKSRRLACRSRIIKL